MKSPLLATIAGQGASIALLLAPMLAWVFWAVDDEVGLIETYLMVLVGFVIALMPLALLGTGIVAAASRRITAPWSWGRVLLATAVGAALSPIHFLVIGWEEDLLVMVFGIPMFLFCGALFTMGFLVFPRLRAEKRAARRADDATPPAAA